MPARGDVEDGAPIWIDLGTNDLSAAVAFYTALFGWEHVDFGEEFGHYGQFLHHGEPVAGVGPHQVTDQPSEWGVYLATSDADAAVSSVIEHGGTVVMGPDDVPGQGRWAMTTDARGVGLAFWQPQEHRGFARVMEPGAPCWFELWTTSYDATLAFYRDAVGWDPRAMPDGADFRYSTNGPEETASAGIYGASDDEGPSRWLVYLGAADVDAAANRVRDLGGTVHGEPVDTPYGRQVDVTDPTGASFRLLAVAA
jgi:predicted enzyme related to lactoylglutathione lyase